MNGRINLKLLFRQDKTGDIIRKTSRSRIERELTGKYRFGMDFGNGTHACSRSMDIGSGLQAEYDHHPTHRLRQGHAIDRHIQYYMFTIVHRSMFPNRIPILWELPRIHSEQKSPNRVKDLNILEENLEDGSYKKSSSASRLEIEED